MPLAHFEEQVLHTHSLLVPCRPSGHNAFPDPLNKPPLLSWLPGAVSCGSSLSGLSDRGGPLLHHPISVVRGSSPDLPHPGPCLLVSPGFSSTHTATLQLLSVTPLAGLSFLLYLVPFSVSHPLLNPVQPSLPQTHCHTLSVHMSSLQSSCPPVPLSVTFPVPFRSFHTPLTYSWGTFPFCLHPFTTVLIPLASPWAATPPYPSLPLHRALGMLPPSSSPPPS